MANFKITTVGRLVSKEFPNRLRAQIADSLRQEQQKAIKGIVARTKSGKNVKGQSFPRYTEGYRKFKAKRGLPTSPVNLTFTGRMLNSVKGVVRVKGNKIEGEIRVDDPDTGKVAGVSEKRPWFGVSKEVLAIFEGIRKSLNLSEANR